VWSQTVSRTTDTDVIMRIVDTHAHLDHCEQIEESLKRAADAGVGAVLAAGVDLDSNKRNLAIQKNIPTPRVYLAMGLHPGNIKSDEIDACLDFVQANIKELVAIGEIGLDFWYRWVRKSDEKKEEQREVFRRQLIIAKENDLPVIIHSRGAWKYCLEMVKEVGVKKGVFHWYSGPLDILEKILAEGFYVSCTPSLAYSKEAQEAMKQVPLARALIETDSPVYFRNKEEESGFRAEPKDVLKTLDLFAELKNMDRKEALCVLNQNAQHLFGIKVGDFST